MALTSSMEAVPTTMSLMDSVFEDVDSLLEGPGQIAYFLNMMDGFRANDGVLTLATTNHPEVVDAAILKRPSRFDRVWKIGDPDLSCRRRYLSKFFERHLDEIEIAGVAKATDGFSVAFLKELFLSSAHRAAHENSSRIRLSDVETVLDILQQQMRAASDAYDVQTIGFGPPEDEE